MKKILKSLLSVLPFLIIASCSSTQFTEYRSDEIIQGQGGAVRTVNGIEIWSDGTPNRKFKIVGVIDDVQNDVGNNGLLPSLIRPSMQNSARDSDLVRETKAHGGDAVVIVQQGETLKGFNVSGNVSGTANYQNYGGSRTANYNGNYSGNASAQYSHLTKAFVIKFVD